MKNNYGLDHLLKCEGITAEEFLERFAFDGLVPCVCVQCGHTTDHEPDQDRGWCDECEANTMKSGLILMGIM